MNESFVFFWIENERNAFRPVWVFPLVLPPHRPAFVLILLQPSRQNEWGRTIDQWDSGYIPEVQGETEPGDDKHSTPGEVLQLWSSSAAEGSTQANALVTFRRIEFNYYFSRNIHIPFEWFQVQSFNAFPPCHHGCSHDRGVPRNLPVGPGAFLQWNVQLWQSLLRFPALLGELWLSGGFLRNE